MAEKTEEKDNKKLIIIVLIILLLCMVICLAYFAYAKYISTARGNAAVAVADMICELDVQSATPVTGNSANMAIVNPYCTVTVKNFNTSGTISQTAVQYTIEVVPHSQGQVLPPFYWRNEETGQITNSVDVIEGGNVVARTATLPVQVLNNGAQETDTYTIVFKNTGDLFTGDRAEYTSIQEFVDFNLIAVQAGNE